MSKLIPSISGVACFLWVAVWSWWLTGENTALVDSVSALSKTAVSVVAQDTIFSATEIFSFHKSDDKPVLPQGNIQLFQSLAKRLTANPELSLTLAGSYLPMPFERNQSPFPNLGLARANAIKDILVAAGADPEQIQVVGQEVETFSTQEDRLLGGVEFIFGKKEDTEHATPAVVNEEEASSAPSTKSQKTIKETGKAESALVFTYDENDFAVAKKYRSDLDDLRRLIRENPSYKLIITGYSTKSEEKTVNNLAERRSLAVRRYLVDTGVRRRNIIVESHPGGAKDDTQRMVEIIIVQ